MLELRSLGIEVHRAPEAWPGILFKGSEETDRAPLTRAGAWPPGSTAPSCAEVLELSPGQPSCEGGHGAKG